MPLRCVARAVRGV